MSGHLATVGASLVRPAVAGAEGSGGVWRGRVTELAKDLGVEPPLYKAVKLGSGERIRWLATSTWEKEHYKTYPRTYFSQQEAEEAVAELIINKHDLKQLENGEMQKNRELQTAPSRSPPLQQCGSASPGADHSVNMSSVAGCAGGIIIKDRHMDFEHKQKEHLAIKDKINMDIFRQNQNLTSSSIRQKILTKGSMAQEAMTRNRVSHMPNNMCHVIQETLAPVGKVNGSQDVRLDDSNNQVGGTGTEKMINGSPEQNNNCTNLLVKDKNKARNTYAPPSTDKRAVSVDHCKISPSRRVPLSSPDLSSVCAVPRTPGPPSVCSLSSVRSSVSRRANAQQLYEDSRSADSDKWLQFTVQPSTPARLQMQQLKLWLEENPPSKVKRSTGVGWLSVMLRSRGLKKLEVKEAWEAWKGPRTMEAIDQLAERFSILGGKWMCHQPTSCVDEVWATVTTSLLCGGLGSSVYMAKVSPLADTSTADKEHVVIVYNEDYRDRRQVMRLENLLRAAGVTSTLTYKPDIFSAAAIYRNNKWGLRPTTYSSQCFPTEGRSRVLTIDTGEVTYYTYTDIQHTEQGEDVMEPEKESEIKEETVRGVKDRTLETIKTETKNKAEEQPNVAKTKDVDKGEEKESVMNRKPFLSKTAENNREEVKTSSKTPKSKTVSKLGKERVNEDPVTEGETERLDCGVPIKGNKEEKAVVTSALPEWMENMEKKFGMINIDDLTTTQ